MISWFIARHVLYLMICYSVYAHTPLLIPSGCFTGPADKLTGRFPPPPEKGALYLLEPLWKANDLVCFDGTVKWGFLSTLLFLQGITIFWFGMIVRVAVNVVQGNGADDSRSDDEADGLRDEDELQEDVLEWDEDREEDVLEEEVGVEGIDLKGWERRTGKREGIKASGVSLPGHSDRKELLGRIGCEKQVD